MKWIIFIQAITSAALGLAWIDTHIKLIEKELEVKSLKTLISNLNEE